MQNDMSHKLNIAIDLLADMIIHYLSTDSSTALIDSTGSDWLKQTLWRQMEQESMARMEHDMLVEMLGSKHFRRVA
ncbi:hypothetical protein [Paenibacillus validus]|uniref:hypothetical protein n=1 Tax=Paenibacillus validus TaxID=44253 RepID=UPI003D27ED53